MLFAVNAGFLQVAQGPCPAGFNSHQRQGSLMHGVTHFYPRKLLTTSTPADIRYVWLGSRIRHAVAHVNVT